MAQIQTVTLAGERYVILPEEEYNRLRAGTGEPVLPEADAHGHYPAIESMRVLLARDILRARRKLGLSQAELARRAGVRVQTLQQIEEGKTSPSPAIVDKIDRALKRVES